MNGTLDFLRDSLAPQGEAGIEPKLFQGLAFLGGIVSIFVIIPLNQLQGLFPFVSLLVLAFGLASLALFAASRRGRYLVKTQFFMLMGLLDLIWFGNAGSQGSIGMFFFTAAMYLVIFFKGKLRWVMLGIFLVNGVGLLVAERSFPHLVTPFQDPLGRFVDLVTGFVVCNLVCVLILWVVLTGYHREHASLGQALDDLRTSEARFRGLYENTTDVMFWVRPETSGDFLLEDINPAGERLLGIRRDETRGRSAMQLMAGRLEDSVFETFRKCVATGESAILRSQVTLPSGRRTMETLLVPIRDGEGRSTRLVGVSRDLTESLALEEALRQSQKLESLGVLAGGIAHDFNNLLSAMLGNLNLAQAKLGPSSAAGGHLESVEKAVFRASELTRQMLAYSGRGRFVVEAQDLNLVLHELLNLLRASLSKRIQLEFSPGARLPGVMADAAQLQQVIVNLITNAAEAIGEGDGRIELSTRTVDLDPSACAALAPSKDLAPGAYVCLRITDTGCGMSQESLQRIFEPFYTTKASGRGLGLSAMLGILRGHRAGLRVQSQEGQGSTFELFFPAAGEAPPLVATPAPERPESFQGRALVVDDEETVLQAASASLEALGFEVIQARDGMEALDCYRAEVPNLRFVLMDLTMPRMDGRAAFQAMQAAHPGIPVILTSGYDERDLAEIAELPGFAGFLQKPFRLSELRALLRKALGPQVAR
jgi:PAS domain S-box-containing protein